MAYGPTHCAFLQPTPKTTNPHPPLLQHPPPSCPGVPVTDLRQLPRRHHPPPRHQLGEHVLHALGYRLPIGEGGEDRALLVGEGDVLDGGNVSLALKEWLTRTHPAVRAVSLRKETRSPLVRTSHTTSTVFPLMS